MPSQAAKIYFALFLTFLLIAVNTPVNFIYWMCGALGATLAIGFLLALFSRGNVRVRREHPETILHGETAHVTLLLHAQGVLNAHFLFIEEYGDRLKQKAETALQSFLVARLRGGSPVQLRYAASFPRRGHYKIGPCVVSSGWPLGLFVREKEAAASTSLYVLPRAVPLSEFYFSAAGDGIHGGDSDSLKPGHGIDMYGTREYRPGDSLSHIHWRSTAKRQTLIIKEFEGTGNPEPLILIDLQKGTDIPEGKDDSTLETAVTICASIGHFFFIKRQPFYFVSRGAFRSFQHVNAGRMQYEKFLKELSLIQADGAETFADVVQEELSLHCQGVSPVLISSSRTFWSHSAGLFTALSRLNPAPCAMIIDAVSFSETHDKSVSPSAFYKFFIELKQKGHPAYYFTKNMPIAQSFAGGAGGR